MEPPLLDEFLQEMPWNAIVFTHKNQPAGAPTALASTNEKDDYGVHFVPLERPNHYRPTVYYRASVATEISTLGLWGSGDRTRHRFELEVMKIRLKGDISGMQQVTMGSFTYIGEVTDDEVADLAGQLATAGVQFLAIFRKSRGTGPPASVGQVFGEALDGIGFQLARLAEEPELALYKLSGPGVEPVAKARCGSFMELVELVSMRLGVKGRTPAATPAEY